MTSKFDDLRLKYPVFEYCGYDWKIDDDTIEFSFNFTCSDIVFKPTQKHSFSKNVIITEDNLKTMAFYLGMIELISYYKAFLSPVISIKCGKLSESDITFWSNLYLNGLGEFFYINNICFGADLFKIVSSGKQHLPIVVPKSDKTLIPVGGGKDSIVSLEILKNIDSKPFVINSSPSQMRSILISGYKETELLKVDRNLDKKIIELNNQGFWNGHTPFSAMLAITSSVSALLNGFSNIALSNEFSASEGNIIFNNMVINHQYSKSLEAERAISQYIKYRLSESIHYFSFLRPFYELKIAELFTRYDKHLFSFRSCNKGSKSDSWCGNCPKCLFVASILLPFVGSVKLISIFKKDIFSNKDLLDDFKGLTGLRELKPLECVGTINEVKAAISKSIRKENGYKPFLIQFFLENFNSQEIDRFNDDFDFILKFFNNDNLIEENSVFHKILLSVL
ncbi:MAG: hypothetical protein JXR48_14620 [Candidatus Delongbacteria bacterium]|nr:hypothetical protein [Candidatus Delongbacteria bacterium]MBN2836190.1 hypothetical protein [Candidatus Delongbacteria bacterium]